MLYSEFSTIMPDRWTLFHVLDKMIGSRPNVTELAGLATVTGKFKFVMVFLAI